MTNDILQVVFMRDGKPIGIFELEVALRQLGDGRLRFDDLYWHQGMSEWCRVEFLRENVFWYMMQRENEILEDRYGLKRAREDQAKAEIFEQFRKAAEAGDADAQNDVGFCLINGYGTPTDLEEGIAWLRKSAAQGHAEAKLYLARFIDGLG